MFLNPLYKSGKISLLILISFWIFSPCAQADSSQEKSVLATVQKFFDALATSSPETARSVLLAEGCSFSIREENGEMALRNSSLKESIESLASVKDDLLERMWDPQVLIHEHIAVVWTKYDFHRNQEFSHCGLDVFTLIKTGQGWKIASIVYTVEKAGCQESPLGPIRK